MEALEQLIAEQQADDTSVVKPEWPEQVPFTDGLANCIGMESDGEIVTNWPRPPRGTLLVGTAEWHGTYYGYTRMGCRKECCRAAKRDYIRHRRLNGGS